MYQVGTKFGLRNCRMPAKSSRDGFRGAAPKALDSTGDKRVVRVETNTACFEVYDEPLIA